MPLEGAAAGVGGEASATSTEHSVYVRMSRDRVQPPLEDIVLVTQRDPSKQTTRLVCSLYEAFYEA